MDSSPGYRAFIGRTDGNLQKDIERALDFVEWRRHVDKETTVFVKPNLTLPYYKEGVTTSPKFLQALLTILKSGAGRVIVGESDGGNHSFGAEQAFAGHGILAMCSDMNIELVNLSRLPAESVEGDELGKHVKVQLPALLLHDIGCFLSAPVLKIHVMTTISFSLKNSWGCYPDTMRGLHHRYLSRKLALIAAKLQPKLIIGDGTYCLNRHGPMFGEAVKMDLVLGADNTVVADALAASVMGFDPRRIEHIRTAQRAGLGPLDLAGVSLSAEWQQYKRQFYVRKTIVDRFSALLFASDTLARLVMASPLTPLAYRVGGALKSSEEQELSLRLKQERQHHGEGAN